MPLLEGYHSCVQECPICNERYSHLRRSIGPIISRRPENELDGRRAAGAADARETTKYNKIKAPFGLNVYGRHGGLLVLVWKNSPPSKAGCTV